MLSGPTGVLLQISDLKLIIRYRPKMMRRTSPQAGRRRLIDDPPVIISVRAPRPLGRQGPGQQAIIVSSRPLDLALLLSTYNWKLPPYDAGDDSARVCFDELKFIPAVIDHEEAVSRQTERRNLDCVGTGAIRIHCICAGSGHCLNKSGVGFAAGRYCRLGLGFQSP